MRICSYPDFGVDSPASLPNIYRSKRTAIAIHKHSSRTMLSFVPSSAIQLQKLPAFSSPLHSDSRLGRRFLRHSERLSLRSKESSSVRGRYAATICVQASMNPVRRLSVGEVAVRAADHLLSAARASIAARGVFTVAISGGSLPSLLAAGIRAEGTDALCAADPEKWIVLFADERVVPLDHEDSNYRLVKENLTFIPAENIVGIDPNLDVEKCAQDYAKKVTDTLSKSGGRFDVVYLGLGPDGHTASLFPGHELLSDRERIVAPVSDSPKPPPARVTLTFPVINNARAVAFACTGDAKAAVIKDVFENPNSSLPGALIIPDSGELDWFIDAPAASAMSSYSK